MKRLLLFYIFILGCENEQAIYNPYIPDISFERVINLNLPSFDNINYTGGSVALEGLGVCGVILFNFNNDILAWESCDPNHKKNNTCPKLDVDGIQAKCQCEGNLYSLATGQILNNNSTSNYPMIRYKTERVGSNLRVFN